MAITMKCPSCATAFDFPDELRGKRIKCKSCGEIFKIEPPAPKPAPKPVAKTAPASKSAPAVKPATASKSVPAVKPAPAKAKPKTVVEDDEDDRPRSKRRDEDEEEDRPRAKRRAADDDDEEDEKDTKASRRKGWDEDADADDDRPAKKRGLHPLLIIGPVLGVVAVGIVVAVLLLRGGGKKDKDTADGSGAKGPGVSATVELPEKDITQLIVADTGNLFATFRKPEALGSKTWELERYDMAAGKSLGKSRLPELETPRYVAMSGDGKYVIVEQTAGFNSERALMIFNTEANAVLTPKWLPYDRKNNFQAPTLYKAEFVGNDKMVTISTARGMDMWQLPGFGTVWSVPAVRSSAPPLQTPFGEDDAIRHERFVAFSADRKQLAVWTGTGYAVTNVADGSDIGILPVASLGMKDVEAGPVAWRPDGKTLAMVFKHGNFGSKIISLVLWNPNDENAPAVHPIYTSQYDESKGINWWGNRYIATTGSRVEGVLIDSQTGKVVRQLMVPAKKVFSFSRNGRLWYAVTPELKDRPNPNGPATVVMADSPDELIEKDGNQDPYEDIPAARGKFLRRLWMEPTGVLKTPARYDPPLTVRLVGQP